MEYVTKEMPNAEERAQYLAPSTPPFEQKLQQPMRGIELFVGAMLLLVIIGMFAGVVIGLQIYK